MVPAGRRTRVSRAQRIYVYFVLAVTAIVGAIGASELLGAIADQLWPGRTVLGNASRGIALGISMLAVAGPVWVFHWRLASRHAAADPTELDRGFRQAYLALLLAVSLGVAGSGVGDAVTDLSGGRASLSGDLLARLAVWSLVWAFHWRQARRTWRPGHAGRSWHRWYLYAAAAGTLFVGVIGLSGLVDGLLSALYDAAFRGQVLHTGAVWTRGMQEGLGVAVTGLALWAFHWRVGARNDSESTLRDAYSVVAAVAASATGLVAAGVVLQSLIRLPFGDLGGPVADRLADLTGWVGLWLAVGLPFLYYAPLLVRPTRAVERSYARPWTAWACKYAALAAGVGALAAAAVVGISTAIGASVPSDDVILKGPGEAKNAVATILATALLGALVWGGMALRLRAAASTPERTQVRRFFLFGVTGAGLLAAVGGGATALYFFLNDALTSSLGAGTGDSARWAVAVALVGGSAAYLHSRAIGGGIREALSESLPARRRRVVLLAPAGSDALRALLEAALGREVEWRVDLSAPAWQGVLDEGAVQAVAGSVEAAPGRNVTLMWTDSGLRMASSE